MDDIFFRNKETIEHKERLHLELSKMSFSRFSLNIIFSMMIMYISNSLFVNAAYCTGSPEEGERTNDTPIQEITADKLNLLRQMDDKTGSLYQYADDQNSFMVLHLYGSPYEMGYAHGSLMKAEVNSFVTTIWSYLKSEIDSGMPQKLPKAVRSFVEEHGMAIALDKTESWTKPHTPSYFYEELQGLCDGAALSKDDCQTLIRIHMLPELTKGSCSFVGAWGKATEDGKVMQVRALDWDVDGPFKDYPQITVYHPKSDVPPSFINSKEKNIISTSASDAPVTEFATIGFTAFVGAVSGMNNRGNAISEIGVSFPDDSFGQGTDNTPKEKLKGEPFVFVLRDLLQLDSSIEEATTHLTNIERTCNLILGFGDGQNSKKVSGFQYSGRVLNPYEDTNLLPANSTWHPVIEDAVYNGMDWLCPAYTDVLGQQLNKYHGSLSPENMIHNILPTVQTGNLHIAVYDLTKMDMYVSFARESYRSPTEPTYAFQRGFFKLSGDILFENKIFPNTQN